MRRHRPSLGCWLAACALLLSIVFVRPGGYMLRSSDAGVYAEVARQLAAGPLQRACDLRLDGQSFTEHPPAGPLIEAALFAAFGSTPKVAVSYARFMALCVAALTCRLAWRLAGPWAAWGSFIAWPSFSGFLAESQNPMLELPLVAGLLTATLGLVSVAWPRRKKNISWGYATTALGSLLAAASKGPPALLVIALAWSLAPPGPARRRCLRALCLSALFVVTAGGLFAAWRHTAGAGPFWRLYFANQLLPSMARGRHNPQLWPTYYLPILWRWYAPGMICLIWVLARYLWSYSTTRGGFKRTSSHRTCPARLRRLALVWIFATVGAFALMPQKYQWYMHTAAPGFALLIGSQLAGMAPMGRLLVARWGKRLSASVSAALCVLAQAYPAILAPKPAVVLQLLHTLPSPDIRSKEMLDVAVCCGPWGWRERYVAQFLHQVNLVNCDAKAPVRLQHFGWQKNSTR